MYTFQLNLLSIHQIKMLYSCRVWKDHSFFSYLSKEKICSALHRSQEGLCLQKNPKASPWGIHIPGLPYSCLYWSASPTETQPLSWKKKQQVKSRNDHFGTMRPKDSSDEVSIMRSLEWRKFGIKRSRGGAMSPPCWQRKTGKSMNWVWAPVAGKLNCWGGSQATLDSLKNRFLKYWQSHWADMSYHFRTELTGAGSPNYRRLAGGRNASKPSRLLGRTAH